MSDTAERERQFEELLDHLKRSRGFDFSAYKRSSLGRRVQKRMQAAGIDSYARYSDYLEAHPQEFTHLFNTILINVTAFFRDQPVWDFLATDVIPRILKAVENEALIRVWSAGCSSGEEAYSLAMLFADALGMDQFRERMKIYATDVDEEALNQGRTAVYSDQALADVPADKRKYFEHSNGRWLFHRELRRSIIFGRHDLIQDPPISRVMLLACRNSLMYFNAEVQQRILERFHFGIHDGGFLFLGKAEMLLTRYNTFTPVDLKKRIFVKVARPAFRNGVGAFLPLRGNDAKEIVLMERLRELTFQTDPAAQMVIDQAQSVVLLNDRMKTLFGLTADDIGKRLQDLEISFRPVELRSMVDQALRERSPVGVKEVEWMSKGAERLFFDVEVMPLTDSMLEPLGARIVFRDTTRTRRLEDELKHSHQELETANEELQSTNEELETTNEELQSTVEELETTNEELQSTNEELETMNEELQSTNEELQTANEQLRQSGEELNRANAFFENVLNSFHEGLIVVDAELRVQAWNHRAEDLWGLRSSEVVGKHLMNLDIGLPTEQLRVPLRRSLSGESMIERLKIPATNRRGRSVMLDVATAPFSLGENPTWGAIVTMQEEAAPAPAPGMPPSGSRN